MTKIITASYDAHVIGLCHDKKGNPHPCLISIRTWEEMFCDIHRKFNVHNMERVSFGTITVYSFPFVVD